MKLKIHITANIYAQLRFKNVEIQSSVMCTKIDIYKLCGQKVLAMLYIFPSLVSRFFFYLFAFFTFKFQPKANLGYMNRTWMAKCISLHKYINRLRIKNKWSQNDG